MTLGSAVGPGRGPYGLGAHLGLRVGEFVNYASFRLGREVFGTHSGWEAVVEIGRSYNVSHSTISRL
jgi:hypothetical protein